MIRGIARRFVAPGLFVVGLFAVTVCRNRPETAGRNNEWSFSGPTMGTVYTVKVAAGDLDDPAKLLIHETIRAAVDRVDRSMSTYEPGSEVCVFNRSEVQTLAVSEELLDVVAESLRIAESSGGAFDITVAPLVDAWGFGPDGLRGTPTDAAVIALRDTVGWQKISIDRQARTVSKSAPGVHIDLSAIAKGYAVDCVVTDLQALGFMDLMVEIGGEVRTSGCSGDGSPWRIGVERPDTMARTAGHSVELGDRALATSGDYRNFYENEGRRISHTIDPRTGRPIEHGLASVSVIAPTCGEADGWATALNVLGPVEGFDVAERNGLAALFIERVGDDFRERESIRWSAVTGENRPDHS